MKIKGSHTLPAKINEVWLLLEDPRVLERISPGETRIEPIEKDHYTAISNIQIGPVKGSFEGTIDISDKRENESMTLKLNQKSKIGNASATIVMDLTAEDSGQTLIHYNGDAKVTGKLATMGQRILGGVISTLTRQVFSELETIITDKNKGDKETSAPTTRKNILELLFIKIKELWKSLFK